MHVVEATRGLELASLTRPDEDRVQYIHRDRDADTVSHRTRLGEINRCWREAPAYDLLLTNELRARVRGG